MNAWLHCKLYNEGFQAADNIRVEPKLLNHARIHIRKEIGQYNGNLFL